MPIFLQFFTNTTIWDEVKIYQQTDTHSSIWYPATFEAGSTGWRWYLNHGTHGAEFGVLAAGQLQCDLAECPRWHQSRCCCCCCCCCCSIPDHFSIFGKHASELGVEIDFRLLVNHHFQKHLPECQNVSWCFMVRVAASPKFSMIQLDASRCKKSQEPAWWWWGTSEEGELKGVKNATVRTVVSELWVWLVGHWNCNCIVSGHEWGRGLDAGTCTTKNGHALIACIPLCHFFVSLPLFT